MLMAAGLGTRLRPFTELLPKPLLPVMGIPTARFMTEALATAGVRNVVANIHHLPDVARSGVPALAPAGMMIVISDESQRLLGSSGGIRKALPLLGQTFFIANGDILCSVDFDALARRHYELRKKYGVVMTLALKENGPLGAKYREIVADDRGRITAAGDLAEGRPFYTGIAVAEAEAFAHLPENEPSEFVPQVLKPAIVAGKAGAFLTDAEWYDMGSPGLWLETHLTLIRKLEEKALPRPWEALIRAANKRLAPGIWVGPTNPSEPIDFKGWTGPSYWEPCAEHEMPPRTLGPDAVLYGKPQAGSMISGIGLNGLWSGLR